MTAQTRQPDQRRRTPLPDLPAAAPAAALPMLADDPGAHRAIPLGRLVRVENRKLVDTVAGRWMVIATGLVLVAVVVTLFFVNRGQHDFMGFSMGASNPMVILLPIIGIMAATSEWSQRTAMTTFSLEPRRGRIALAKILSVLWYGLVAVALTFVAAALGHLAVVGLRDAPADWTVNWWLVAGIALAILLSMLQGTAFGMALMNTPGAIVAYLLLPMLLGMIGQLVEAVRPLFEWIDASQTFQPLMNGDALTSGEWSRLAVSMALWVGAPLAIGVWRMLRREVK